MPPNTSSNGSPNLNYTGFLMPRKTMKKTLATLTFALGLFALSSTANADFAKLAQLNPGKEIVFKKIKLQEAEKYFHKQQRILENIYQQVNT